MAGFLGSWGVLVLAAVVLAKYTFYPDATSMRFMQGIMVAVLVKPV